MCIKKSGKPVFESTNDKGYIDIYEAVKHTAAYLNTIKRFDMEGFVIRPDYYREMIRFGVIDEDVPIEEINPYVADSIYWSQN